MLNNKLNHRFLSDEMALLSKSISKSAFKKNHGLCNVPLDGLLSSYLHKVDKPKQKELDDFSAVSGVSCIKKASEIILNAIPAFQRENDKWSIKKQQMFILNVLLGYKPEITFFRVGELGSYKILDGLQRTTALLKLFSDADFLIPIDHDLSSFVSLKEVVADLPLMRTSGILFKTYTFQTELEAVDFYLSINRDFSHSEADIARAIDYKRKLLS
ncbi:DUF262 domain-containing protein [Vibrio sp. D431a]|uniref:DUF262 domain-containing protein n=1 Tax=Vibrio sp. D431a TaxID=2837388 RepID=UPI0025556A8D|nr:DUF262 domain-containing protein [Vibrio sp. D431a]MDK9789868.1 hypothetical protein [Vibrio sp. D431a]